MKKYLIGLTSLIVVGCNSPAEQVIEKVVEPVVVISDTATYELTFSTKWTAANFPTNYPTNRHFSGLVGATHTASTHLFELGELASDNIITVAETGAKDDLKSELDLMVNAGTAEYVINEGGLPTDSTEVKITFTVSQDFPLVSIVSMVAPSPDWFVGVDSLALLNSEGWAETKEVPLLMMDSGSDSAEVFVAENSATTPREVIKLVSTTREETDITNGVHYSTGQVIGTFTFKKIEE